MGRYDLLLEDEERQIIAFEHTGDCEVCSPEIAQAQLKKVVEWLEERLIIDPRIGINQEWYEVRITPKDWQEIKKIAGVKQWIEQK